jgi:hypothetical protein
LQDSVKRYKETPVKLHTGEKPQSKVCTGTEKTPVQRHKKNPSPQVKRYIEESRLKGAKATLMQLKLYKPPPPPSTKLDNSAAYCYVIGGRKDRVQKEHLSKAG